MIVTIIAALVAAAAGAGAMYLGARNKTATPEVPELDRTAEIDAIKKECEEKTQSIRKKYEDLLSESKEKISELDSKLALALDGKFDELSKGSQEEVEKIKKKVKQLENNIEDLKDNLVETETKLKNKSNDNDRLNNEIDESNRKIKHLKEDIEQKVKTLDEKIADLDLANGSLSFVQEVLSAEEADDENTRDLYEKVSNVVDFVEFDLRDTVKEIYNITDEADESLFGSGLEIWAAKKKKSWLSGKTSIAFVGEFSAGKTSIVNRILSQDDPDIPRLPVSTKATTAIPTYITGTPKPSFQFFTPNNVLKKISPETFRKVNKEVLDHIQGVSSLIKYFVMGYKNPNLDELSILDTPGFNSNDPEDAKRTTEVINECDALFWVFDVNAGTVNRSSLELIKKELKKPLYIVINKVDTKPESEVEKVEKLINSTLEQYGVPYVQIIRFSAKAPLSDIMTPINQIKRDESQETYLYDLKETISDWVKELNDDVLAKKKETDGLSKKIDGICDKYNQANAALGRDCEEAVGIPNYKPGVFGIGEGYKMSNEQYNYLKSILQRICTTRVDRLCDLFNEMMKVVNEYSSSYDAHLRARGWWQSLNEANERLNKITSNIK